jgi:hypothetical protein
MADKGGDRAAAFSLKDHLFNADTLGQLAAEYAAGLPGFPAGAFLDRVLPGLAERGLLERIDWIADCIEPHLAPISRPWPTRWRPPCPRRSTPG